MDVTARVRIDAICIGRIERTEERDAVNVYALAEQRVNVPKRRISDRDAFDEYIGTFIQLNERRPKEAHVEWSIIGLGDSVLVQARKFLLPLASGLLFIGSQLMQKVPPCLSLTIDRAAADNGYVFGLIGVD